MNFDKFRYIPVNHFFKIISSSIKSYYYKITNSINRIFLKISCYSNILYNKTINFFINIYFLLTKIINIILYWYEIVNLIFLLIFKKSVMAVNYLIKKVREYKTIIGILLFTKSKSKFTAEFYNNIVPLINKYFNEAYIIIYNKEIKTLILNYVIRIGFEESDTFNYLLFQFLRNIKISMGEKTYNIVIWFWGSEELFNKYAAIWLYTRIIMNLSESPIGLETKK